MGAAWDSGPQTSVVAIVWYFSTVFLAGTCIDSKLEFDPWEMPQLNPFEKESLL